MLISKTRLSTIRSIMTVVLSALILVSLILSFIINTHKNDTFENYHTMSTIVRNSLDAQLQNIRRYSLYLEINNSSIDAAKQFKVTNPIPDSYYQLSLDLLNYQSITPIVDDLFIYYPKSGFVIGDMGCYPMDSYIALKNGLRVNSDKNFIDEISEAPIELSVLTFTGEKSLSYIRRMGNDSRPTGYIVFSLNVDQLLSSYSYDLSPQNTYFQISLMADDEPLVLDINTAKVIQDNDITTSQNQIYNDGKRQVHFVQSAFNGLTYITSYDLGESYRSMRLMLAICIMGMLLILVVSFILSMNISAKSNKPLDDLISKFGISPEFGITDEYEVINFHLDKLLVENSSSLDKMQTQQDNLDSLYLFILLSTSINKEEHAFMLAKRFGIMMECQYYYSIVFVSPMELVGINYEHFFPYVYDLGYECWAVIRDKQFILILHTDEAVEEAQFCTVVNKIKEEFFSNFKTSVAVSPSSETLLGIRENCFFALDYLNSDDSDKDLVFLSDIMEKYSFLAPQLKQALTNLNSATLTNLLDDIFADQKALPTFRGHVYAEIFNAYFREAKIDYEIIPAENGKYWKSIFLCAISTTIDKPVVQEIKDEEHKSVALQAKKIIDQEYTDYYLGLYKLSGELGVSNSYLSTTFKETYGVGILQYTNELRIKLAKNMVLNTDKNIKDIALEVGFSSDISFIRVFKRYMKKTPGKMRKNTHWVTEKVT